jgi:hypothetical protein
MASLIDYFESPDDTNSGLLRECRLGPDPVMVLLFTDEVEEVRLHYESDESVRSYFPCPGEGCPHCHLGSAPQDFLLVPVFSIERQAVEVLRVSRKRGPGSLGSHLLPHLRDPDISRKVLIISRNANRYRLEARPLAESADRGAEAIEAFSAALKGGLKLVSAFPLLTPADIAGVERVRRKLDAIGYRPPEPPGPKAEEDD